MHDRAITMITERLAKEGIIVFHSGGKWFMAGGNFIVSSDARFPGRYPIPVHDRTED